MIQLNFRRQDTGRLIARVEADDTRIVPVTDDHIYVPSAEEPGVYRHCHVVGRDFFYNQAGLLTVINLVCVELASQPAVVPPTPADPPAA